MTEYPLYLDPPPHSWRSRRITIQPKQRYAEVVLDRDGYVESHGDGAESSLAPEFREAVLRLQSVCNDRVWLGGYSGAFTSSDGARHVALAVPYGYADEAAAALRVAELDADMSGLEALSDELGLPIDEWLSPGERFLGRGVDFDATPSALLGFLRAKAHQRGLRLNGRATTAGVWVRPGLSAAERSRREALAEQSADQPGRRAAVLPSAGPQRPRDERTRDRGSTHSTVVEFFETGARPRPKCPCGRRLAGGEDDAASHEAQHLSWSLGVRIPRTVAWGPGDIALVTTQSGARWRRLVEDVARVPQRENHYDFPSWDAGARPAASPNNQRAYLLRFQAWIIGYLVAADLEDHCRLDFESGHVDAAPDTTRRPSIDLIWVAATHRHQGLGRLLVERLADDFGCLVLDVSWSSPLSRNGGEHLAKSVDPEGVWLHA